MLKPTLFISCKTYNRETTAQRLDKGNSETDLLCMIPYICSSLNKTKPKQIEVIWGKWVVFMLRETEISWSLSNMTELITTDTFKKKKNQKFLVSDYRLKCFSAILVRT